MYSHLCFLSSGTLALKKSIQNTNLFLFSILRSKRGYQPASADSYPLNDLHCFFIKFNDIPDRRLSRICHDISALHGISSHQFNLIFRYTNIGKMLRNTKITKQISRFIYQHFRNKIDHRVFFFADIIVNLLITSMICKCIIFHNRWKKNRHLPHRVPHGNRRLPDGS